MIGLVLLFALVVVLIGGQRLGAGLRGVSKVWRPTSGLLAVLALMAAAVVAIREDWWVALLLVALSGALALGARHRKVSASTAPAAAGRMSAEEACAILGLPPGATPEAVDVAYRRLIRVAHPDQGGTVGLAAQLNTARATLKGRASD